MEFSKSQVINLYKVINRLYEVGQFQKTVMNNVLDINSRCYTYVALINGILYNTKKHDIEYYTASVRVCNQVDVHFVAPPLQS